MEQEKSKEFVLKLKESLYLEKDYNIDLHIFNIIDEVAEKYLE